MQRLIAKTARSFDDLTPVFSAEEVNQWYAEHFSWRFVGDKLPEPKEGVEYICVDDEGVYWLCEYDYNQHDEAVFTVLGSEAQPYQGSITHWMPKPPAPVTQK